MRKLKQGSYLGPVVSGSIKHFNNLKHPQPQLSLQSVIMNLNVF